MTDELSKERAIPKPEPIVPVPGLPATDCMGDCCDQHYTIRAATQLVKAGRKIERDAMKVGLEKFRTTFDGAKVEPFKLIDELLKDLAQGKLTGLRL